MGDDTGMGMELRPNLQLNQVAALLPVDQEDLVPHHELAAHGAASANGPPSASRNRVGLSVTATRPSS